MKYVFLGIQGSGKGTQAKIIAEKEKICHISTGDLLRAATGSLKDEADKYMSQGKLIPDELMLKILKERMKNSDCQNGFILDGFPRNLEQAKALDEGIKIDNAFNIEISDEEAIKRLKGRWNCKKCGIAYNYVTSPKPKQEGICDKCGEKLTQRADDIDDRAISQRLKTYHEETTPIIKFYNTVKVNGMQPIEKVTQDIEKAIKFLRMFK
jgi:adenylate kinase